MGLKCDLLNLVESFLFGRQRSVATKAGMPQGSVLGPFFSIYINDLSDNVDPNVQLFVNDTSMFFVVNDPLTTSVKILFQIFQNKLKTLFHIR